MQQRLRLFDGFALMLWRSRAAAPALLRQPRVDALLLACSSACALLDGFAYKDLNHKLLVSYM